ncbi:X8 domain [Dillenia turbinata]|uniref:X8 domain n=1 Tax=Dillenia turbinata TaxID=194707 RepID=A0AAN8YXF7_9MAGN
MRPHTLLGMLVAPLVVLSITIESNAQRKEWCVARRGGSDAKLEEAMRWVCNSGANCTLLEPYLDCFCPDDAYHHASYAFNNYYQKFKKSVSTCSFDNRAMLVDLDPSKFSFHFLSLLARFKRHGVWKL